MLRVAVYILVGIPLVPVAAIIGWLTTCIPFPLAIIGIISPPLWEFALGMAAIGTMFVLPLASTLCDIGLLKADLYYKSCGSAGSIICMCFLAVWLLQPDHSNPHRLDASSIGAFFVGLYVFGSISFGAYAAGYYSAAIHRRIITDLRRFYEAEVAAP